MREFLAASNNMIDREGHSTEEDKMQKAKKTQGRLAVFLTSHFHENKFNGDQHSSLQREISLSLIVLH